MFSLVFKISCAIKNADGSNSPFTIEFSISLEDLQNAIAEKIERHPNVVWLRYKLANNKVKSLTMLIQNNDELQIFIKRIRILLIPQRLASGKCSKHVSTKNTMVCFKDGIVVEEKKAKSYNSGKGKKKVQVIN
jgi:hypothetical protein